MKVHDRHDVDAFRLDTIQEAIGKLRNQKTPEPAAKRWARGRELEQSFVRGLNRKDEVEPESFRLALVKLGCRYGLRVRLVRGHCADLGTDFTTKLVDVRPDGYARRG